MPRGGHNRKPAHLKMVQGTQRKDRINSDAPDVDLIIPEPSENLSKEVKSEYKKLASLLIDMRVLSEADQGELENLAIARAQIKFLSNKLFCKQNMNEFRKVQIALHDAVRVSASLSARFGLSPADRDRVSVIPDKSKKNPFANLDKI